jgi:four helix bundle protein
VFGLSSQWRRASTSLALNLSEGYGETYPLFTKYYKIFKGSLRECVVCSEISFRRKYIDSNDKQNSRSKLVEFSKMIVGLRKYLKKKDKGLI